MKNYYRAAFLWTFTLGLALVPTLAQAHPGVHHTAGFGQGLSHPLSGLDHVLAMLAVGLWAAQLGGRAIWCVPASFVGMMTLGAALGFAGVNVPGVEQSILASVLVLGLFLAAAVRLPLAASVVLVAVFAFFHGSAHGAEMSRDSSALACGAGFLLATTALHGVGLSLGLLARKAAQTPLLRVSGAAIATIAVLLALGLL
jgi:urease accessory protein